jgi:signal transduction histidine kinase
MRAYFIYRRAIRRTILANPIRLSLVFKFRVILACYVIGILIMGYVSQADIHTIGEKQQIMEFAYQLNNIILEVRRYEKNYLLYNSQDALDENAKYLAQAREILANISVQAERFKISPKLRKLSEIIDDYGAKFAKLSTTSASIGQDYRDLVTHVREQGKQMSNLTEELTVFEHYQIRMILETLKGQLVIWAVVASMIGILMPFLISLKIFKPLNIIKNTTEEIASGRFKTVEVLDTRDEMQQVMEAFNTMVRELELKQDQLVQSKKLSSIGTLTAGVAHQLNNPLNNISTSCQIAIDDFDSGDRELLLRMLKNIEQETLRARDVVKGLLEFSRVRQFSLQPTHLLGVVNRAVRLVQSHLSAEIWLQVDVPEELVLPLDTLRIQEVFLNLIINAAQSIDDKGKITISATTDPTERVAVIEVNDTGAGIPKEIQERLFDPFYTTKEEGKGTGLGLSIVYGIIQHHRGTISVKSEPGQGASFIIRLPLDPNENV